VAEVAADRTEVAPSVAEVAADPTEVAANPTVVARTASEVAANPTVVARTASEVAANPTEVARTASEVAADPTVVAQPPPPAAPAGAEVAPGSSTIPTPPAGNAIGPPSVEDIMRPVHTESAVPAADAPLLHEGAALFTTSPFEERWLAILKRILGPAYQETGRVLALVDQAPLPNLPRVIDLLRPMHAGVRARLKAGASATAAELSAYVAVGLLLLNYGFDAELQEVADTGVTPPDLLARFQANHRAMFALPGLSLDVPPAKVALEVCYQVRRAFHILHTTLRGISPEAGKLRARVWNACFPGGDLLAYARGGHARRTGVHTLILGDTGTGKELVARALAYARHLPYSEADQRFTGRATEGFHVVNTSGLAVNLVDSLLFGHKKGAFTGADRDMPGVLAKCAAGEVLFLDEFGDLPPEVQVKLLRVIEQRKYTPVGATEERALGGTLVFAAQPALFRGGGFRRDMRHRLHEHVVRLPSLRARIDSDPAELPFLVQLFAREVAGPADAEGLVAAVLRIAEGRLRSYPWSGNVRELRGCVSNVHEQREYEPPSGYAPPPSLPLRAPSVAPAAPVASVPPVASVAPVPPAASVPPVASVRSARSAELARAVTEGTMSLAELRDRYIVHVFGLMGRSYKETAKRLEIDWRTVRAAVEAEKARAREAA
jgi:DNA-binding NtrC family response regulator